MNHYALTSAALLFGASASHAALTFVDATLPGNTTGQATTTTADTAGDNLWRTRTGFGTPASGGTIYEADGNSGIEDAPLLQTVITGLTPGQSYNVWVNFYDVDNDANQNWGIQAGFSGGSLTSYADSDAQTAGFNALPGSTPAVLASSLTWTVNPKFDDGSGRMLFAGALGSTTANGSGEITVFIDDLATSVGSNNRTWYDGVAYEIVPEPSVAILGGLGLLGLLRRRR